MQWWILEYLASEKFVLASESNMSLATGLVSWKVSLKPCIGYNKLQFVNKVKMERITVFMRNRKSAFWKKGMFYCFFYCSICENRESIFWKKIMFFGVPVQKFWRHFCENQRLENFVLASCSFKAHCQLHRLSFTWLDVMMEIRGSDKWKICFG